MQSEAFYFINNKATESRMQQDLNERKKYILLFYAGYEEKSHMGKNVRCSSINNSQQRLKSYVKYSILKHKRK